MLVWDTTCSDTLAPSHSTLAVREAGAVAADAEYKKTLKYMHLDSSHCLFPLLWRRWGCLEKQHVTFQGGCQMGEIGHRPQFSTPISCATHISGCPKRKCGRCPWVYRGEGCGLV